MFNEFHVVYKSAKTMVFFSPYQYVKMCKAQDLKTQILQYSILFGTVYQFRHKRQNNKTVSLSYQLIIHFVILRNFYNKKETLFIKQLKNPYFTKLNALSNHGSANSNASCRLHEKKLEQKLAEEKILRKKLQKFEANQY